MTERPSVKWTIKYTLLNMAYFAAFCTLHAYAAVYLLSKGFTNTEVGVLLAVANIVSAVLQPIIAGIIDKPGYLTNRRFILIAVLVILAGTAVLMVLPGNKLLIFAVYSVIYMVQLVYQPVVTALCFEYQKAGCNIYYGLARGMGSAGFAITSMVVGSRVEHKGVSVLLVATIAAMILSVAVIALFRKPGESAEAKTVPESADMAGVPGAAGDVDSPGYAGNVDSPGYAGDSPSGGHSNFVSFMQAYPAFAVFLIGTICFFFAHNMINDFMIQIIRSLGGNETELGYSNFLQAILELPVMALIGVVLKRISAGRLLIISGVAFFVKILILVFASSMPHMYFSQSFQLFAYAVFIPAGAYYVSETMEELDQVKGQAFITSAITIGGVFSNLISGVILDNLGIKPMLMVGSAVCAAGVVITFVAMTRLPHYTVNK